MEEAKESFGDNSIEDVNWVCSLSESELDFLISLKMLIVQRATVIGHEELVKKFDLKMLRALGFVLMEYLKGKVKDFSHTSGMDDSSAFLDGCNFLNCKLGDISSIEDLNACLGIDGRKRPAKRSREAEIN